VSNPIIAVRNVRSTLSMKNGQVLTVGGLLRNETRKVIRKVPWLGDIPGLGLLFQSIRDQSVNTQLIFFLRVNILPEGRPYTITYHRPGVAMEGIEDLQGSAATRPADQAPATLPATRPGVRRVRVAPPIPPEPAGVEPSLPAPTQTAPAEQRSTGEPVRAPVVVPPASFGPRSPSTQPAPAPGYVPGPVGRGQP